jgi:hypothetical protein
MTPNLETTLRELLDVMDNLERAVEALDPSAAATPVSEGVRQIHRQLGRILGAHEVRQFTSVGTPFDPHRHEAIGQIPSVDIPKGSVVSALKQGYFRGGALFRPAQVAVSTGPPALASAPSAPVARTTAPARPAIKERSSVNVPDWVRRPPTSDGTAVYLVGRATGAPSVEDGKALAAEAILPDLLAGIPMLVPESGLASVYTNIAEGCARRRMPGMWSKLVAGIPNADRWVADFYWHQVESDLSGRAYDVAVLLSIKVVDLQGMLSTHGEEERGAGLSFVNLGAIVQAMLPEGVTGVLVTEVANGGLGARSGLRAGDVVTHLPPKQVTDAVAARRLLNLASRGRRPFEIRYVRDFVDEETTKCEPMNAQRR